MDLLLFAAAALLVLLGGAALWAISSAREARRQAGELSGQMVRMTDLFEGRLKQMAEGQAASQAGLTERLHAQERLLSKALEERLGEINKRLGEGLEQSSTKTLETMGKLEARLAVIDQAQRNIQELGTQIVGLQDILANKQARGAFGEVQLKDLVTDMLPPSAYEFQATLKSGRRVDCLLKLPNPPGPIAIDAKFPLESYRALREAEDEGARAASARAFRSALSQHVKDIDSRYIVPGETADSALMFLPSEAVYAELHANFPDMVEASHRAKVWIVSPTTLMATLLTVRAVLKDARMHEQTALIRKEVAVMLADVRRLGERVGSLRKHFRQAGEDIDLVETSAEKVVRRGEKIEAVELEAAEEDAGAPRLVSRDGDLIEG